MSVSFLSIEGCRLISWGVYIAVEIAGRMERQTCVLNEQKAGRHVRSYKLYPPCYTDFCLSLYQAISFRGGFFVEDFKNPLFLYKKGDRKINVAVLTHPKPQTIVRQYAHFEYGQGYMIFDRNMTTRRCGGGVYLIFRNMLSMNPPLLMRSNAR